MALPLIGRPPLSFAFPRPTSFGNASDRRRRYTAPMIFDVPIHPLVIHAVVIFVPALAAALLLVSVRTRWRERYRWAVAALAVGAAVAAFIANQSGQTLRDDVRARGVAAGIVVKFGDHPDRGNQAQLLTIAAAAVVVVSAAASKGPGPVKRFEPALHGLALVVALGAAGVVTLAGHTGAALVHRDVGTFVLLPPTQAPAPAPTVAAQAGGTAAATPTPIAQRVEVALAEFSFKPAELHVKTGAQVTAVATNGGVRKHTFTIPLLKADTGEIAGGASANLSFTAPAPGRYNFLCTVGSHAEEGMVGVLVVDP